MASLRTASALAFRHSQSLARRRHRQSQAKVRSTVQRFGQHDVALGLIGSFDDLHIHLGVCSERGSRPSQAGYFLRGLTIQMTNPKAVLAWIAIVSLGLQPEAPAQDRA